MKGLGIDMGSISADSYQRIGKIWSGGDDDLNTIRKQMMGDKNITEAQKKALDSASTADDPKAVLMGVAASLGREHTVGSDQLQIQTDIKDILIKLGNPLLDSVRDMSKVIVGTLGALMHTPEEVAAINKGSKGFWGMSMYDQAAAAAAAAAPAPIHTGAVADGVFEGLLKYGNHAQFSGGTVKFGPYSPLDFTPPPPGQAGAGNN